MENEKKEKLEKFERKMYLFEILLDTMKDMGKEFDIHSEEFVLSKRYIDSAEFYFNLVIKAEKEKLNK